MNALLKLLSSQTDTRRPSCSSETKVRNHLQPKVVSYNSPCLALFTETNRIKLLLVITGISKSSVKLIWPHVDHFPDGLNDCFIILSAALKARASPKREHCSLCRKVIFSSKIGSTLCKWGEDTIHVRLFFPSLKQPQGLFYKCCKARTRACVALLECVSLLAVHYPFCCWINGAIDQRQTCVSQRTADHSPTARPDTGAPIRAATARMITDAWLGRGSKEEPRPTPFSSDRLDTDRGGSCSRGKQGRSGG